jgi:hypothetical protein
MYLFESNWCFDCWDVGVDVLLEGFYIYGLTYWSSHRGLQLSFVGFVSTEKLGESPRIREAQCEKLNAG